MFSRFHVGRQLRYLYSFHDMNMFEPWDERVKPFSNTCYATL